MIVYIKPGFSWLVVSIFLNPDTNIVQMGGATTN